LTIFDKSIAKQMGNKFLLFFMLISGFEAYAQKSQVQIAQNSLGKLQASIGIKADAKKQLAIIGEGIKAIELAQSDKKTKNWPETWAIKAYLSSYIAIIDDNTNNADKYYDLANEALEKAKKLDKYQDNSGLIKASNHNINIKKQTEGNKAYQQNDFFTAYNLLKQVSDYLPTDTTLAVNVALCAQNIQSYNEALNYFKRAKENGIKNPLVFQIMANTYASKFESELAIKTLEEGLVQNPYHPFLTNDYINLLLDNEKYDKALKVIEKSAGTENRGKLLMFLHGYLQQTQLNNFTTAETAYKKALDIDQNYFDALYQLTLVYINYANEALKQGSKQKFVSYINRSEFTLLHAHEINPNDKNTIQLLIEIYSRKNRLDKVQDLKRKLNEF
jgi:tetratricopeptide (TPR) repeat protein